MKKKHIDACANLIRGLLSCDLRVKDMNVRVFMNYSTIYKPILDATWDLGLTGRNMNTRNLQIEDGPPTKSLKFSEKITQHMKKEAMEKAEFEKMMDRLTTLRNDQQREIYSRRSDTFCWSNSLLPRMTDNY